MRAAVNMFLIYPPPLNPYHTAPGLKRIKTLTT
jgi:hypothetical protein